MTEFADQLVNLYQALAGVKSQVLMSVFGYQPVCKHNPSCSQYTRKMIRERGTIIGLLAGMYRIIRCW